MQETIYNIIPKQPIQVEKGPLHKSKYPPNIPPTGSTFALQTTSQPLGSNLNGDFSMGLKAHTSYAESKTFGHTKGARKPSPENFLKKNTGTMGDETLPPRRKFSYDWKHKKPAVPTANERPAKGNKSMKNFVASNAIENIISVPKKQKQEVNWLKKKNYGQIPNYIERIKQNVSNEYKMIQNLHEEQQPKVNNLSPEQVKKVRDGLKQKWNEVNHEYQKITHVRIVDTIGLKRKKEKLEKQLSNIETDIRKLNKDYVFVDK